MLQFEHQNFGILTPRHEWASVPVACDHRRELQKSGIPVFGSLLDPRVADADNASNYVLAVARNEQDLKKLKPMSLAPGGAAYHGFSAKTLYGTGPIRESHFIMDPACLWVILNSGEANLEAFIKWCVEHNFRHEIAAKHTPLVYRIGLELSDGLDQIWHIKNTLPNEMGWCSGVEYHICFFV